jgi:hypothetical protein
MTELNLYGKDGLFNNIVKKSAVFSGRYGILVKNGDLNANNILSGIEFPKENYPGVFALPPMSSIKDATTKNASWECFYFRLFFLCRTHNTGDNQIKKPDPNTNSSLHSVPMDWNDMKNLALNFMNALEVLQPKLIRQFRLGQREPWKIVRISNVQNDNLSGVMLQFEGELAMSCTFDDINTAAIDLTFPDHPTHFH